MSRVVCTLAALPLFCVSAIAAMPFITLESPSSYYAGRETVIELKAPEGIKSISWNLRCLNRTIASGQTEAAPGGNLKIKFHFPELNDGVITSATLTCLGSENDTLLTKKLNFFPPNPFKNSIKFLTEQKIELLEASGNSQTCKLFSSLKIPFTEISGFDECTGRILIISGMDFDQYSGLQKEFIKLMQRGVEKILVINPAAGTMPLSLSGFNLATFANNSIIKDLNPKLDFCPSKKSLSVIPSDDSIALFVNEKNPGNTYCLFKRGKSELYILSWDIAELAENSPVPVYILSKLILSQ